MPLFDGEFRLLILTSKNVSLWLPIILLAEPSDVSLPSVLDPGASYTYFLLLWWQPRLNLYIERHLLHYSGLSVSYVVVLCTCPPSFQSKKWSTQFFYLSWTLAGCTLQHLVVFLCIKLYDYGSIVLCCKILSIEFTSTVIWHIRYEPSLSKPKSILKLSFVQCIYPSHLEGSTAK